MAAYALTRFAFRGAKVVQLFLLAGLMLPLQQVIIPLFFQMRWMHLLDTLTGLGLVYVALGLPFGGVRDGRVFPLAAGGGLRERASRRRERLAGVLVGHAPDGQTGIGDGCYFHIPRHVERILRRFHAPQRARRLRPLRCRSGWRTSASPASITATGACPFAGLVLMLLPTLGGSV